MKKELFLFSIIIFILINSVNVNAANLLFNTSFENAILTQMNPTEICMNLPYSNVGIITSDSGEMWVEDGSRMTAGALPHSGANCIGGRTKTAVSGSPRAEYEITHLNGMDPWCAPQALDISTLNDVYVSVWLYLPSNYGFSKATYHEIINPFVFTDAEMSPRTSFHIHQKADGNFSLWLEYDYRKAGAAGLSYKIWWVLADTFNISTVRGKWTKWAYLLHRSNNPDEAYMQAWLNDVPFTATPRDPTNTKFTDLNGLDDHGNSRAGRDDWYEHTGESGTFRFVTAPESNPNWWIAYSKMYHDADNQEHLMWADDLEIWDGIPSQESVTLSGKLVNKIGSSIQATISINSIKSSTDPNGNYLLSVPKGIYDVNYSMQNFWIKLISFDLNSNQKDIINYITKTSTQTSFQMSITKNQMTQMYSDTNPIAVKANGTNLAEVFSLSDLTNDTWFYGASEKKLYMMVNPLPTGCACTNWANQGCNSGGCTNNQQYQTRACSPIGCALTSQCVYNASCIPTCSDGTLYEQCSSTKPLYCDNGNLIEKCSQCGCGSEYECNAMNGECYTSYNYNFIIYKNGTNTCMKGANGILIECNANTSYVINKAITNVSSSGGGSILVKNGDYSLSSSISMKSNVKIALQLNIILNVNYLPTTAQGIVDFRGVTNAHFVTETEPADETEYPKVIGQGTSNNEFGVFMTYGGSTSTRTTYSSVGKIAFSNIGGYGISLRYADNNVINGTYVRGFTKASGGNHHGLTIRVGSYNKLINCHIDGELGQYTNHPLYFGGEGPVTYNEVIGGIYENSASTHAIYWCSEVSGPVDHNKAINGISRGCRGSGYSTGFKLNAATNSEIRNWTVVDCSEGLTMGDGNAKAGGNHGNVIDIKIINCRKGAEFMTQNDNMQVQNNTVNMDVNVDLINYPATGEVGYVALGFSGWIVRKVSNVQNNTIYLKVRNYKHGVVFADWDLPQVETQQAIYNTLYLDVNVSNYAIYWMSGCGGYGTYNTFYGYWHGLVGNCPTVPNADYVHTDNISWTANIATNTFNPSSP